MTDTSLADGPIRNLRLALPECSASRALSPAALRAVSDLCLLARRELWLPEKLLVVVKNAFYSSRDVAHDLTPSERDSLLSIVVSACISQYYADGDCSVRDCSVRDGDGISKAT